MSHACQETGLVTEVTASNEIRVRLRRAEACHSCDAAGVCHALGGRAEDVALTVENTLDAAVGDEVSLSLPEWSVIKGASVLYLLPALGVVFGAVAAAHLFPAGKDTAALLGALLGGVAAFLAGRATSARMARDRRYMPVLTHIVSRRDSRKPASDADT